MILLFMVSLWSGLAVAATPPAGKPWTVRDSVRVRYLVTGLQDQPQNMFDYKSKTLYIAAPGGHRFFILTFRGILERDCVESELLVFSTEQISAAAAVSQSREQTLAPLAAARLCSNSVSAVSGAAISVPSWIDDDTILFRGIDGGARMEHEWTSALYTLSVRDGRLRRMTAADRNIWQIFGIGAGSAMYSAFEIVPIGTPTEYPVSVLDAEYMNRYEFRYETALKWYAAYRGRAARELDSLESHLFDDTPVRLAPNGRWAISVYARKGAEIPEAWRQYVSGEQIEPYSQHNPRFMLIDLKRAQVRQILDAPWGLAATTRSMQFPVADAQRVLRPDAFWSADSRSFVLVNTALPFDQDVKERRQTAYIVSGEVSSSQWRVLEPTETPAREGQAGRRARQVGWLEPGVELLVTHETLAGERVAGTAYRYQAGQWVPRAVAADIDLPAPQEHPPGVGAQRLPARLADGVSVELRQSANDPPVMMAIANGREVALTGPDPALSGLAWNRRVPVEWTDPDGGIERGSVVLPHRKPGAAAPPLVIQAYFAAPDVFLPDGNFTLGQAAQAMAAQGMAVMFMDIPATRDKDAEDFRPIIDGLVDETEAGELQYFVRRVDAVVEELARRDLIDPKRVGLIGFSRGGLLSYYTITHPGRTRISATIVLDSGLHGWNEYLITARRPHSVHTTRNYYDVMYGDRGSFWENKPGFTAGMPIFNVDRIQGPILFQYINDQGIHAYEEHMRALSAVGVPWEWMHYGPSGIHWLHAPRQRLESMQASLDWMNFWLQGIENPDSERRERNARWREMREQLNRKSKAPEASEAAAR